MAYNVWANTQMVQYMLALGSQRLHANTLASFPPRYKTLVHMYKTEAAWFKRLELNDQMQVPGNTPDTTVEGPGIKLRQQSERYQTWVTKTRFKKLLHVIAYRNTKKEEFTQPVYQILMHLFNYQTYHQGQLVSMFYILELANIPNTDFINFTRRVCRLPKN